MMSDGASIDEVGLNVCVCRMSDELSSRQSLLLFRANSTVLQTEQSREQTSDPQPNVNSNEAAGGETGCSSPSRF